jgi:chemotaxis protein MotC
MRGALGAAAMGAALFVNLYGAQASNGNQTQLRNSIRTLERIQDASAYGDHSAADIQSRLIIQIEADLNNAKQSELQDEKNQKAIVVYLFSGGSPDVAERRLTPLNIDPEIRTVLDGALAYARGDKANAAKLLATTDETGLPPNLGGRVALAKAILTSAESPQAALALLSSARALMPGTLVEEAALRRCIGFAGKLSDIEHLKHCASLYIRHFPKSVYWQEFEDNFIISLIEVDYLGSAGTMQDLNMILDALAPANHRKMLLSISRAAIGRGKFSLTKLCAAKALEMSRADSADMMRAHLYSAAAMIVQDEFEAGTARLVKIDKSLLDQGDRTLLAKALDVTRQIAERPSIQNEQGALTQLLEEPKDEHYQAYTKLLARVQSALTDLTPATPN